MQRLECGHTVDIVVGLRLFAYYDLTFAVVTHVGEEDDAWHDFDCDGSPYKPAGGSGLYNAARLACAGCGLVVIANRRDDPLVIPNEDDWQIVRA